MPDLPDTSLLGDPTTPDGTDEPSDALVFFGASGDLAFKQIIPALYAMTKHGRLDERKVAGSTLARRDRGDRHVWRARCRWRQGRVFRAGSS